MTSGCAPQPERSAAVEDGYTTIPGVCDDGQPYYGVDAHVTEMFARPGDVIVAEQDGNAAAYEAFYDDCYSD